MFSDARETLRAPSAREQRQRSLFRDRSKEGGFTATGNEASESSDKRVGGQI